MTAALADQGFSEKEKQSILQGNIDRIIIEEGTKTQISNSTIVKRSRILRKMAITKYSDENGSIACRGCEFVGEHVYGPEAKGMIEIHHVSPLFARDFYKPS